MMPEIISQFSLFPHLFFKKYLVLFFCVCMGVLPKCMFCGISCVQCLRTTEEGVELPGNGA